jgi:Ni,Fe-hydrogenase III small subunit/Pyruvate/2-oxoacid:ferredoxin oxidoreductase delta subunit
MYRITKTRIAQGYRTVKFPKEKPAMPDRFKGLPVIDALACAASCEACFQTCPVNAISRHQGRVMLDMGKCLFCGGCESVCPHHAIRFTSEYAMATRGRQDLIVKAGEVFRPTAQLEPDRLRLFRRSFRLREVSAGGCNACEGDVNVLNTIVFDLSRFGIQFVASPRHADGLLTTGPVSLNMELALKKTYEAIPDPKVVIAVGACAISGGMFSTHRQVHKGVDEILPVDLYIPGCPPNPYTILDGILRLSGNTTL